MVAVTRFSILRPTLSNTLEIWEGKFAHIKKLGTQMLSCQSLVFFVDSLLQIKHRIHIMLYRPQQLFLDQNIVGSLSFSAICETKVHLHCGWPTGVYHQAIAVTSALGASVTPGMSVYLL